MYLGKLAQRLLKRRLPERALLERLSKDEDLLRQNNITLEPLQRDSPREKESLSAESGYGSDYEHLESVGPDLSSISTTVKPARGLGANHAPFMDLVQEN